jgi:hypothetical protein
MFFGNRYRDGDGYRDKQTDTLMEKEKCNREREFICKTSISLRGNKMTGKRKTET